MIINGPGVVGAGSGTTYRTCRPSTVRTKPCDPAGRVSVLGGAEPEKTRPEVLPLELPLELAPELLEGEDGSEADPELPEPQALSTTSNPPASAADKIFFCISLTPSKAQAKHRCSPKARQLPWSP